MPVSVLAHAQARRTGPSRHSVTPRVSVLLAWPATLLLVFFALPFALLVRVSVAPHDPTALWLPGVTLGPYTVLAQRVFADALLYSLGLAVCVGALCVLVGFPFAYLLTRMGRRQRVAWLVFLLSTLALSEVLVTFAWQVMLAKRIGLSNLLVAAGLMAAPDSLTPSEGAVISCLVYLILPFTVLTLYPSLSRLDPALVEAARTMGASPLRAFASVVLPLTRGPLLAAFLMAAVLAIGSYVAPLVLGRTPDWTLAILITRTALGGQNIPGAAAIAMLLLAATVALAAATAWARRERAS